LKMSKSKTFLSVAVALAVIGGTLAGVLVTACNSQPSISVYVKPTTQEAQPGQTITASIQIEPGNRGISGVEINLGFNPDIFQAISIESGTFLGNNTLTGLKELGNESGTIRFASARVGVTTPPSPPGVFAVAKFVVKPTAMAGTYDLTLIKVRLTNQDFLELTDIKVEAAKVTITQ